MLLALFISLKTLPFSGRCSINWPYFSSQSATISIKHSFYVLLWTEVTLRKISLNRRAETVLGYILHQLNPCLWICTIHRWIMIPGHKSRITLMTWALPSVVQLIGCRPWFIRGWKKDINCLSEFSLTPYLPLITVLFKASISTAILVGRLRKVPSKIKYLCLCKLAFSWDGVCNNQWLIIRYILDWLCWLCSTSCLAE